MIQNSAITPHLKDISYYRTGGNCANLVMPDSAESLQKAFQQIVKDKQPYYILGGGTNSLISDEAWPGAVICFNKLNQLEIIKSTELPDSDGKTEGACAVKAAAGVENTTIAELLLQNCLTGGAWMYYLPGQIGGTVRMNARCFGGEISQVTVAVRTLDPQGNFCEFTDSSMFRGYKDTVFMRNGHIIIEATLVFNLGNRDEIQAKMLDCKKQRDMRGHFNYPSCGCVFKNNYAVGVSSGILLDAAGVKGWSQGKAEVNPDHANFIYNLGGAGSSDILELSFKMQNAVYDKFGVWLEYEMEVLGVLPDALKKRFHQVKPQQFNEKELLRLRPNPNC